jgi:hypothetical protein
MNNSRDYIKTVSNFTYISLSIINTLDWYYPLISMQQSVTFVLFLL